MSYSAGKIRRLSHEEILVKKVLEITQVRYATGSCGLHIGSENQFPTFMGPSRAFQRDWRHTGQLCSQSPGC